MSSVALGFIGLGAVTVLLALRVPVAIALSVAAFVGLAVVRSPEAALGILGSTPFDFAAHWTLSAIPMFLLMGDLAFQAKMTSSLFAAGRVWVGRLPGGLAIATSFASAGFAAASGSSLATAAAMTRIATPEMLKLRYDPGLATAVAAAGGTLGALIPPSVTMVIYGWIAEQPIGKLLIAGVVPGLLTALIYSLMIGIRCWINPNLAPAITEVYSWRDRWRTTLLVWPIPALVLTVIIGLYSGVFTATEAGACGAFMTLLIGLAQRKLGWREFRAAIGDSVRATANILFIAIGAILLTKFLGYCGVPAFLSAVVRDWGVDAFTLIVATSIIYLILGCFLDPLGIMLLTLPVLLPMFRAADIDLIWMGVIIVKYIEIGLLTPPVGLNAFVVSAVVGKSIPLTTIFRGLSWFLVAEVFIMAILIGFPQVILFLPNLMGY